jgi:chromate reductase
VSETKPKILALSGSLREGSSTNVMLNVIASCLAGRAVFAVYDNLGHLPHFDDRRDAPPAIMDFRQRLSAADGIFICTPEYAFGVPGTLKNALDWTYLPGSS